MNPYHARRATTDDLEPLMALWHYAQMPAFDLEKRFTEFQIVEQDSRLVAAIALTVDNQDAQVHSEIFSDFSLTDVLRPLLWERLQLVAQGHGIIRLWTDEPAPFWKLEAGFAPPAQELLQKRPASFEKTSKGAWLTLQIKDEAASFESIDRKWELHRIAEQAHVERIVSRGRTIYGIAIVIAALLFLFAVMEAVKFLKSFHR